MPGTHPARRCRLSPRTSLTRVLQELLEQPAQFERRALAAVRHHGRCDVARAIDLPVANRHAAQSWIALRSTLAALPFSPATPRLPWLTNSCQPEPGQGPGASLSAMKLPPLRATTSRRRYSWVSLNVPRTVMLLPSRPAVARQIQSACDGGCPVSRFAWNVAPS